MGPETSAGTDEENGSPSRGAVRASFPRKVGYTGHETMLSACTAPNGSPMWCKCVREEL